MKAIGKTSAMRLILALAALISTSNALTDCDGSEFADCTVFGVDGSEDCTKLLGDGVCDWGQRILSNGDPGPNFKCAEFLDQGESTDCDCPDGTLTCSGYCLSDEDCKSEYWKKDNCHDWRRDDVCDFGQRSSTAGIEMHFECEMWNWDNNSCDQSQTCEDILTKEAAEVTCPANFGLPDRGDPTEQPTTEPTQSPIQFRECEPEEDQRSAKERKASGTCSDSTKDTMDTCNAQASCQNSGAHAGGDTDCAARNATMEDCSDVETGEADALVKECMYVGEDVWTKGWEAGKYITDCNGSCVLRKYFGDGICDWGQRIRIPKGTTAPVFRCPDLLMDDGDCNCEHVMTCDGYCLTDEQCKSEYFRKESCVEWSLDNVCDFGQRVTDYGIEINFECADWNYDNLACSKNPEECVIDQAFADATCDPGFPTTAPTHFPTELPTIDPTPQPSNNPTTAQPSEQPTTFPTHYCPDGLVDCQGNCWDDCRSSWLPGHKEDGKEGCFSYIGDGVCDMGQRLLRFNYEADICIASDDNVDADCSSMEGTQAACEDVVTHLACVASADNIDVDCATRDATQEACGDVATVATDGDFMECMLMGKHECELTRGERSNYWGPDLNCKESVAGWGAHMNEGSEQNADHKKIGAGGWDGGDCDMDACEARGGMMTCDGFCLTDDDCAKADYGYTTCQDWKNDSVCDYGQRYSDIMININFNCAAHAGTAKPPQGRTTFPMWGDNGWCPPPEDDDTCATVLESCPEPMETLNPTDQPTDAPTSFFADCDGTVWNGSEDCASSWIPTHKMEDCGGEGDSCCDSYIGDGVCDWGQRLIRSGKLGPNLMCDKFENDGGDCDCEKPKTMTCDGFCVSDKDCAKKSLDYDTCDQWWKPSGMGDTICDHGQRYSDIMLNMNFNCEETVTDRFNYDGQFCHYDGPDDEVCEWIMEQECEAPDPIAAPTSEPTAETGCEQDKYECWDGKLVGRNPDDRNDDGTCNFWPTDGTDTDKGCTEEVICEGETVACWDGSETDADPMNNCDYPACPDCPDDTIRCWDGSEVARDPETQCNFADCPVDPCAESPELEDCENEFCVERVKDANDCLTCECVPGKNLWCTADAGPGLMDSPMKTCDTLCSDAQCEAGQCVMRDGDCCDMKCVTICEKDTKACDSDGGQTSVERDPEKNCEFRDQDCPDTTPAPTDEPTEEPSANPTNAWDKPLEECYEITMAVEDTCAWKNLSNPQDRQWADENAENCKRACQVDPDCAGMQFKPADENGQGRDCDLIELSGDCNFGDVFDTQDTGGYNVESKYCFNMDCADGTYWNPAGKKCQPVTACSFPVQHSTRAEFCNGNGDPQEGEEEDTCVCVCDEGYLGTHCEDAGLIEFSVKMYHEETCNAPICVGDDEKDDCSQPPVQGQMEGEKRVGECFAISNDAIGESAKVGCMDGKLTMSIFAEGDANCENPPVQNTRWDEQGDCIEMTIATGDYNGQAEWNGPGCPRRTVPPQEVDPGTLPLCGCFGYYSPAHSARPFLCRSQVGESEPQCFAPLNEDDPQYDSDKCPETMEKGPCARACDDNGDLIYAELACRPEGRGTDCTTSRDCASDEHCEDVFFDPEDPAKAEILGEFPSLAGGKCVLCPDPLNCTDGKCHYEDLVCCGGGWGKTFMGKENERDCDDHDGTVSATQSRKCEQIDVQGKYVGRWAEADECPGPPDKEKCLQNGDWNEQFEGETTKLDCPLTTAAVEKCDSFGARDQHCTGDANRFQLSRLCLGGTEGWESSNPAICPGLEYCPEMTDDDGGWAETSPGSTAMREVTCKHGPSTGETYNEWRNCQLAMPGDCVNDDCWETAWGDGPEGCDTPVDVCAGLNNKKCVAQVGVCDWCGEKCATLKSAGGEGCPEPPPAHPCVKHDKNVCDDPTKNGGLHCVYNKKSKACVSGEYKTCMGRKKKTCEVDSYCTYDKKSAKCMENDYVFEFGKCSKADGSELLECDVIGHKDDCAANSNCGWTNYMDPTYSPTKAPTHPEVKCEPMDETACGAEFQCEWYKDDLDAYCWNPLTAGGCTEEDSSACKGYDEGDCSGEHGNCCEWNKKKSKCSEKAAAPAPMPAEASAAGCDGASKDKKKCKKLKKDLDACAADLCCEAKGKKCIQSYTTPKDKGDKGDKGKKECKCSKMKSSKKCIKGSCKGKCEWDGAACADIVIDG